MSTVIIVRCGTALVAVAALGIGLAITSPTIATSGPLLSAIAAIEWCRRRRAREVMAHIERLPAVADRLIQRLRSGLSLRQSCELVADSVDGAVPALGPLAAGLRARKTLTESATDLLSAAEDPGVRLLSVTIVVLAANGGPAVPALQRLRHTLAGLVIGRQRLAAESSQAMASAGLLTAAPAVFMVVLAAVDPEAADLYLFEPVGAVGVGAAIALSYGGWWWMQRILRRHERMAR